MSGTEVVIRRAEPEDGPALVAAMTAIDAETEFLGRPGEYGDWPEKAAERLKTWREKDSGGYFLALEQGDIVGFLSIFRGGNRRGAGAAFIPQVGLRASHRGRGIGGRLFEAAETWARGVDVHRFELRVDEENPRGRALYRRMGYEVEGAIPRAIDQDGHWRTHLIMAKCVRDFPPFVAQPVAAPAPGGTLDGIEIRRARADDAAAVRTWEIQLLTEAPWVYPKEATEVSSEDVIREDLSKSAENPRRLILIALSGEGGTSRILGLLGAGLAEHRMRGESDFGLNVLPEAWGRGIGGELASRFELWARANGARRLTCFIAAVSERGRRFAERRSYQLEALSRAAAVIEGKGLDRLRCGKLID